MCSPEFPPAVARRGAILELASRHGLEAVRWWPPNDGDLLVEGLPLSLRQLRADLERALGCKVAIYLADCLTAETRDRLRHETVDLLTLEAGPSDPSPPPPPARRTRRLAGPRATAPRRR
ncbi:MAG TPA: hypothetical protein VGO86_06740 [Candidatus Dormibacteraeota bacterium]